MAGKVESGEREKGVVRFGKETPKVRVIANVGGRGGGVSRFSYFLMRHTRDERNGSDRRVKRRLAASTRTLIERALKG